MNDGEGQEEDPAGVLVKSFEACLHKRVPTRFHFFAVACRPSTWIILLLHQPCNEQVRNSSGKTKTTSIHGQDRT